MTITDSIFIQAPIERVFEVFTDLDKATDRISAITRIEVLEGPAKMQKGTKWRETRKMFGSDATEVMWVTELEPNSRYVVDADSHGAKYTTTYTFSPKDKGVEVNFSFASQPYTVGAKLMGITFALFAGATKKALHQDLLDLKAACEQKG